MKQSSPTPKHRYRVVRWVREEYEVESAEKLDLDTAYIRAHDPHTVVVERYTVQEIE